MRRTIAEIDWKVLRRLHPLALERFSERVLAEIEGVMHPGQSAHQRYRGPKPTAQSAARTIEELGMSENKVRSTTTRAAEATRGLWHAVERIGEEEVLLSVAAEQV
jgi:hypothetical protein